MKGKRLAKVVADRIRCVREDKGMSQGEVARRTGLDAANVCRMERGVRFPRIDILYRVAQALGVKAGDLLP